MTDLEARIASMRADLQHSTAAAWREIHALVLQLRDDLDRARIEPDIARRKHHFAAGAEWAARVLVERADRLEAAAREMERRDEMRIAHGDRAAHMRQDAELIRREMRGQPLRRAEDAPKQLAKDRRADPAGDDDDYRDRATDVDHARR